MLMQRNASLSFPIVINLPRKEEVKKETEEEKKKKKRPLLTWRPKKQWQTQQPKELPGESITIFEVGLSESFIKILHMILFVTYVFYISNINRVRTDQDLVPALIWYSY